jgi:hypothetical protein
MKRSRCIQVAHSAVMIGDTIWIFGGRSGDTENSVVLSVVLLRRISVFGPFFVRYGPKPYNQGCAMTPSERFCTVITVRCRYVPSERQNDNVSEMTVSTVQTVEGLSTVIAV